MEMDLSWLEVIGLLALTIIGVLLVIAFVSWASLSLWQYKRYKVKKRICNNVRFFQSHDKGPMSRETQIWYGWSEFRGTKEYNIHTKREAEGMLIAWGLLGRSMHVHKSSADSSNVPTLEDPVCAQENI